MTGSTQGRIIVDGDVAGSVGKRQTTEVETAPGHHMLRVKQSDRFLSRERSFDAKDEEVVNYACHAQRLWPSECRASHSAASRPAARPSHTG